MTEPENKTKPENKMADDYPKSWVHTPIVITLDADSPTLEVKPEVFSPDFPIYGIVVHGVTTDVEHRFVDDVQVEMQHGSQIIRSTRLLASLGALYGAPTMGHLPFYWPTFRGHTLIFRRHGSKVPQQFRLYVNASTAGPVA